MSGLGKRGKDKVATTDALFQKTEKPEPHKSETMESHKPVKKSFEFSFELAEKLRERAFRERRILSERRWLSISRIPRYRQRGLVAGG